MKGLRIISIVLLILVLPFLAAYVVPIIQVKWVTTSYYDNLVAGNYEDAFKQVHYWTDNEEKVSYQEAKEIWITRVKKLKNEGTYLKEVKEIKFWDYDDRYPKGKAEVVISVNGQFKEVVEYIKFSGAKIGGINITAEKDKTGAEKALEKARSGHINP